MKFSVNKTKRKTRNHHTQPATADHTLNTKWRSVPLGGLRDQILARPAASKKVSSRKRRYERWVERLDRAENAANEKSGKKRQRPRKPFRVPGDVAQLSLLKDAVARHGDRHARLSLSHCQRGAAKELAAMNPWSGARWADILDAAVHEHGPVGDMYMITVFDENFDINYRGLSKQGRRTWLVKNLQRYAALVRKRLRGVPFVLQLDVAFQRHPNYGAKLLSPHWHGIAFGSKSRVAGALAKFPRGFGEAPGGKKKPVYDLGGAIQYCAKDTRCGYVTFRPLWADQTVHRREHLHGPQRLFLLDFFDEWAKPEICIGSGIGAEILRRAKAVAKKRGYRAYEGKRVVSITELRPLPPPF